MAAQTQSTARLSLDHLFRKSERRLAVIPLAYPLIASVGHLLSET
jgi:small neutral amino acid transporter SnatA (MarC family)